MTLVDPPPSMEVFGVELLGVDAHNGRKLLITLALFAFLYAASWALGKLSGLAVSRSQKRAGFWTRQGVSLITFNLGLLGFVSIWFDNPARLATGVGLVGSGLAFALQKVITSFAGYFVILRGNTFNLGIELLWERFVANVIALNFIQTVTMEMGEPSRSKNADPEIGIQSRKYSGRIVAERSAKI